jgi:hypothetical protein
MMLKTASENGVGESVELSVIDVVLEAEVGGTDCLGLRKIDEIDGVKSNSAPMASTADCSYEKELGAGTLVPWIG